MKTLPDPILRGTRREFDIEHLFRMPAVQPTQPHERTMLCWVLPAWQRPEVWDEQRKRKFVEGIFLGLGTGYYVVHQPDWDDNGARPMSGWLIDGQQRLSALRDFVHHGLPVFDDVTWGDLNVAQRRRFMSTGFACFELAYQHDEQRLREIYDRLNFGGVAHTQADRNRCLAAPWSGDESSGQHGSQRRRREGAGA